MNVPMNQEIFHKKLNFIEHGALNDVYNTNMIDNIDGMLLKNKNGFTESSLPFYFRKK